MSLNIKNPETHDLARELAARLNTTVSGAVRIAVQECLQNHPEMHPAADRIARMRAIATRAADRIHATPGPDLHQVMNSLYDSDRLPTSTPITP